MTPILARFNYPTRAHGGSASPSPTSPSSRLDDWIQQLRLDELGRSAVRGGIVYFVVITVIVLALEARNGRGWARFRSRSFVNDIVYTVFYRTSLYGVLWGAAYNGLEARFGSFRIEWAATWPLWVQIMVFWLAGDFII